MQVVSPHPPQIPFHFFPKPSSTPPHVPSVVVKTRVVSVPPQSVFPHRTPPDDLREQRPLHAALSSSRLTPHSSTKRRSPFAPSQRRAKRARSSDSSDATPPPSSSRSRESSIASSASSSSRASTRNQSSPPISPPPSTRSRSRSSSVLPVTDESTPRDCHIDEDAVFDDAFLSSEKVVLRIIKSYVQYFKNPSDPNDRSFDPHPTDYPVGELEFPNSGATERYVLHPSSHSHLHGVWQCPISFLSSSYMCSSLCSTCFMPFVALKHDQTTPAAIVSSLVLSPVSPSLWPWLHCEACGHITNAVLHIDLALFSFPFFLPFSPLSLLVVSARSSATRSNFHLSGPASVPDRVFHLMCSSLEVS
ncbi:hypothetical protein F5148DRAFT_542878 [Russula earlei]|uniref:Uncharacterized protein n=1 Tax=Russula earlei TaxID=71964 RepID=A0ACC0TWG6_9AGAM|nr:hypothetical protein F5148DRAFT_542878 [Russula earlei]